MSLPPYIEAGTILLDPVGHEYQAMHDQMGMVDDWGNPKVMLKDLDPGLDGSKMPNVFFSVQQLNKMGYKLKEADNGQR